MKLTDLSPRYQKLLLAAYEAAKETERGGGKYVFSATAGVGTGHRRQDADRLAAMGLVNSVVGSNTYSQRIGPFGRSGYSTRLYVYRNVTITEAGKALVEAK